MISFYTLLSEEIVFEYMQFSHYIAEGCTTKHFKRAHVCFYVIEFMTAIKIHMLCYITLRINNFQHEIVQQTNFCFHLNTFYYYSGK